MIAGRSKLPLTAGFGNKDRLDLMAVSEGSARRFQDSSSAFNAGPLEYSRPSLLDRRFALRAHPLGHQIPAPRPQRRQPPTDALEREAALLRPTSFVLCIVLLIAAPVPASAHTAVPSRRRAGDVRRERRFSWKPSEISESEMKIDEKTQDCREEAPDREEGTDLNDVRRDEG
jgi:hypothetical protein